MRHIIIALVLFWGISATAANYIVMFKNQEVSISSLTGERARDSLTNWSSIAENFALALASDFAGDFMVCPMIEMVIRNSRSPHDTFFIMPQASEVAARQYNRRRLRLLRKAVIAR